jgi:hypothetical protein
MDKPKTLVQNECRRINTNPGPKKVVWSPIGEVAEWSNAAVLKGVTNLRFFCKFLRTKAGTVRHSVPECSKVRFLWQQMGSIFERLCPPFS